MATYFQEAKAMSFYIILKVDPFMGDTCLNSLEGVRLSGAHRQVQHLLVKDIGIQRVALFDLAIGISPTLLGRWSPAHQLEVVAAVRSGRHCARRPELIHAHVVD
jgi:hypothetical protein